VLPLFEVRKQFPYKVFFGFLSALGFFKLKGLKVAIRKVQRVLIHADVFYSGQLKRFVKPLANHAQTSSFLAQTAI
jgi:hypothetical protein